MDEALLDVVLDRLGADGWADESVEDLVLGALEGSEALERALGGEAPGRSGRPGREIREAAPTGPMGAHLTRIRATGFRGIGPDASLDVAPGPGLTLVLGRNGSGKSSFVEALEVLLTGTSYRWDGKPVEWKTGWRNLHHEGPRGISASFDVEGKGAIALRRKWPAGVDDLGDDPTLIRRGGETFEGLGELGWSEAVDMYRPILSYSEIDATITSGPSKLYKVLWKILGLGDLDAAQGCLRDAKSDRVRGAKLATDGRDALLPVLQGIEDERARRCAEAVDRSKWDLDAVRATLGSGTGGDDAGSIELLRGLTSLPGPELGTVSDLVRQCREAADAHDSVAGTDAARADETARLLREALRFHGAHRGEDCPVCGTTGALGGDWRARTEREAERLEDEAASARRARQLGDSVRAELANLRGGTPAAVERASEVGLDAGELTRAWEVWSAATGETDLRALAGSVGGAAVSLQDALAVFQDAARAELKRIEDLWRPVAHQVRTWLELAEAADVATTQKKAIDKAQKWLNGAVDEIRNDRLQPIAEQAQDIWSLLRQESNVELRPIRLVHSGKAAKVDISVDVDGEEAAGLPVMSQGELNALALSLFLPRATSEESPFRFVVIDDPVQAMDPAKVDGLARVLSESAKDRQVIVFTHDDRLAESVRRLELPATFMSVRRDAGGVVEVTDTETPRDRYLKDAWAVATDTKLGDVRPRLTANFCRLGLEASCHAVARRRMLGAGEPHAEVEERIAGAETLNNKFTLALFGAAEQGGQVKPWLDRIGGQEVVALYDALGKAAHGDTSLAGMTPEDFQRATRRLCKEVEQIR